MTNREKIRQLNENWSPPPELERGRPREVRYTAAGMAAATLAVLLAAGGLALGIGIWVKASGDQARNQLLARAEGRAEARVTRHWRRGSGGDARHLAAYEFEAAGGVFTRTVRLSRAVWAGLKEGQRVPVRYVESDPALSRLEGLERESAMPFWVAPLGPVVLGALVFFIARGLARQRRLLEEGRAAPGMVVRLGSNTDTGREVHYEFLTLGGSIAGGSYGPVRGKAVPAVGTPLTVIYDAGNPGFNRRFPLSVVALRR